MQCKDRIETKGIRIIQSPPSAITGSPSPPGGIELACLNEGAQKGVVVHLWTRPRVARLQEHESRAKTTENSGGFIAKSAVQGSDGLGGWSLKPAHKFITWVFLRLQVLAHHCCPMPSMVPPPLTDRP
jgi:hypothetical protein